MAGGNLTSVFSEVLAPSSARLGPVVVCKGNKTVFYLCFPYSLTQCGSSFWPSWNMLKQNQRGRGGGTRVKRNKEKSGRGVGRVGLWRKHGANFWKRRYFVEDFYSAMTNFTLLKTRPSLRSATCATIKTKTEKINKPKTIQIPGHTSLRHMARPSRPLLWFPSLLHSHLRRTD